MGRADGLTKRNKMKARHERGRSSVWFVLASLPFVIAMEASRLFPAPRHFIGTPPASLNGHRQTDRQPDSEQGKKGPFLPSPPHARRPISLYLSLALRRPSLSLHRTPAPLPHANIPLPTCSGHLSQTNGGRRSSLPSHLSAPVQAQKRHAPSSFPIPLMLAVAVHASSVFCDL